MQWQCVAACTIVALSVAGPATAQDRESATRLRPFSVQLAAGSHLRDGGNLQALSFGYAPWRSFTLLVQVERAHIPTRRRTHPDGFSATRGGTLTWISGEVRYAMPLAERVSPYVVAGSGAGRARPNVNDVFPDPVTNVAQGFYAGGGLRVPLTSRVEVFGDLRVLLMIERDAAHAMLPVRAGLAWRF